MLSVVVNSLGASTSPPPVATATCYDIKSAYQSSSCCGANLQQMTNYEVAMPPPPPMGATQTNPCYNMRETTNLNPFLGITDPAAAPTYLGAALANSNCTVGGVIGADVAVMEQSGTNVTLGYRGTFNATYPPNGESLATAGAPISTPYYMAGLCPVNVHWHLGSEHLSVGQFDEAGTGPAWTPTMANTPSGDDGYGFQCHHYDASQAMYTTPYNWKYCVDMQVGQTYEIHWPHSAMGLCGTPWQYQSPFYDGVFCRPGMLSSRPQQIGVQGQVFTIVNDESYYYPDLIDGMIVDGEMGTDITYYSGSTTGTSRDNQVCSNYSPITWQVDRKCHKISASSFDKMCADMISKRDDMSYDLHPHGARPLVIDRLAADNHADMTTNIGGHGHTGR